MYEFSSSSQCADTRYPPENHLKDEAKSWREILIPERCLGGLISGASSLAGVAMRRRVEHNFFFFGNHGLIRRVDDTGRGICGSGRPLETRHGFGCECTAVKFGTDRIVLFWIRVGRRSYDR